MLSFECSIFSSFQLLHLNRTNRFINKDVNSERKKYRNFSFKTTNSRVIFARSSQCSASSRAPKSRQWWRRLSPTHLTRQCEELTISSLLAAHQIHQRLSIHLHSFHRHPHHPQATITAPHCIVNSQCNTATLRTSPFSSIQCWMRAVATTSSSINSTRSRRCWTMWTQRITTSSWSDRFCSRTRTWTLTMLIYIFLTLPRKNCYNDMP